MDGETEPETNPVFLFFAFFQEAKPLSQGLLLEGVQSNEINFFLSFSLCIWGALSQPEQISAHYSHGGAVATTRLSSESHLGAHGTVLWGSPNHHGLRELVICSQGGS